MTRSFLHMLAWALLSVCASGVLASDPAPRRVDMLFEQWDRRDSPGCAVSVLRDGKAVYRKGFGMASLEQDRPITPKTVFYIASSSKQFTATAVALLSEEGRLALSDDVRRYVPELPNYGHTITISHLIHHTSGLRDYLGLLWLTGYDQADRLPLDRALQLITRQRSTHFAPGTDWRYSNTNYLLLALIVERISGLSLRTFAEQKIFRPLGMKNTQFYDDPTRLVPGRATGHMGNARDGWRLQRSSYALVGDGGLLTTIDDLALWERNFLSNRLGTRGQALIRQLSTPGKLNDGDPIEYGHGLIMSSYRGLPTVSHGGSFLAFQADMLRFPEHRLAITVLCNMREARPKQLSRAIADLYLEGAFHGPPPAVSRHIDANPPQDARPLLPPKQLTELAGDYDNEELGTTYAVMPQPEGLSVRAGDAEAWHWPMQAKDTANWDDNPVRFIRSASGEVEGFVLGGGTGEGLRFRKRRPGASTQR